MSYPFDTEGIDSPALQTGASLSLPPGTRRWLYFGKDFQPFPGGIHYRVHERQRTHEMLVDPNVGDYVNAIVIVAFPSPYGSCGGHVFPCSSHTLTLMSFHSGALVLSRKEAVQEATCSSTNRAWEMPRSLIKLLPISFDAIRSGPYLTEMEEKGKGEFPVFRSHLRGRMENPFDSRENRLRSLFEKPPEESLCLWTDDSSLDEDTPAAAVSGHGV
ncbi:uncharacterized protein ATNIH1004_005001 [Aspergillus tanneri]|uniref:Uncharacterized protein n=1 Tax=Aspergillus tanneri TaxID=1220188 RepID=A0A5M9MT45_9EURO|nr:uncharacterized protein ATNIH1004_005001 [Aspergillus tanneri]KAA8649106.1 hypothetical protein ATNIH1004_005001 [Aspergillus tanneri]